MAFPPSVLLLDDGELTDVRRLLDDLGVDFVHLRGAGIGDGLEPPRDLLLTTARRAQTIPQQAGAGGGAAGPVRVVVANEEAETLRERLRQGGVDFLVRRPIHSEALRLLVLRALYRGPEKRSALRVPFGVPVTARAGEREIAAVLAELSAGGCRLLVEAPVAAGSPVEVDVAAEPGDAPLALRGRVIRCQVDGGGGGREAALAVEFDPMPPACEAALARTLLRRAVKPQALGSSGDRRAHARRAFEQTVTTLEGEAGQALVGRDLSLGGMRVDPHPKLAVGDTMRLALYGFGGDAPAMVRATVVRDDGEDGLALRFDAVPPDVADRLEALVTSLPPIEPLCDGETAALGAVLSAILPDA